MIKKSLSEELDRDEMRELHEPSVAYTRNTELPMFLGQPMLKGTFIELKQDQITKKVGIGIIQCW